MGRTDVEFIKSEPGDDPIIVEAYLDASPAEVFRAWTNPIAIKRWFGTVPNSLQSATVDLRVGGEWRFVEHKSGKESNGFEGEYVAIEPERLLIFTWVKFATDANGEWSSTQPSRVEVGLSRSGTGTDLRVTHSGIVDDEMRRGFVTGWNRGITGMRNIFTDP